MVSLAYTNLKCPKYGHTTIPNQQLDPVQQKLIMHQVTSQIYSLIIEAMFNTKVKHTTSIPNQRVHEMARLHILELMFFFF